MAYSYNTCVHSTTNFTPVQLNFGHNLWIPIDILYGTVDGIKTVTSCSTHKIDQ